MRPISRVEPRLCVLGMWPADQDGLSPVLMFEMTDGGRDSMDLDSVVA